jgi:sugar lactone lactonase YvrE
MTETSVLRDGLAMGESPRWHDGRLWVCDWVAGEILVLDADGDAAVVTRIDSFPFCIDWLPAGELVVVDSNRRRLLRMTASGDLVTHADLSGVADHPWNEIVVDGRGNVFVNSIGFDMMGGAEPGPGIVAVVTPDGDVRPVADAVMFPNGMAVTPDDSTLIVAESYGKCLTAFDIGDDGSLSNRRVWADLGGAPDGICLDADGAVWCACYRDDEPHTCCVRVAEGGEILERIALDRFCFACMLGGPDGDILHVVVADWNGPDAVGGDVRTGQVRVWARRAPAPHAGRP